MSNAQAVPEFTIITVTLNSASTLSRCIKSIKAQAFKNFEYIIIDGVSQDSTHELVNAHAEIVSTFVSEPDSGLYDAMNKGIKLARGRFVGILNSDDEYLPETLSVVGKFLQDNPDTEAVYGDLLLGEVKNAKLEVPISEISTRMIPHPTVFVALETYREHGAFDTTFKVAADYELVLRLRKAGVKIRKLDVPLAVMHPGGFSARHRLRSVLETCVLQLRYRETNLMIAAVRVLRYFVASYAPRGS